MFNWVVWGFCVSGAKVFQIKVEIKGLKGKLLLGVRLQNYRKNSFVSLASSISSSLQGMLSCWGMREDFAVQGYLLLNFIVTRSITCCYLDNHVIVTMTSTLQVYFTEMISNWLLQ